MKNIRIQTHFSQKIYTRLERLPEAQRGFSNEAINSRDPYPVSEGKNEEVLSKEYGQKASSLRESGFNSFAECVDNIAKHYAQRAIKDCNWEGLGY